jgi:N-acyl-D-aspartate/D-glutamate deacylase
LSSSGEPGNEGPLSRVLGHDRCLFETDTVIKRSGYPNPATMGAFPKILGDFCRQRRLFTLENAVRRMTSASAERFGLTDRGLLKPGMAADVVVFDADTIAETPAAGATPAGRPRGIEHVFINGSRVVSDGSFQGGRRAGRILGG